MFNAKDLFYERLKAHIKQINRYLRYILNGHFMIAILFAIITVAIYYQKWLAQLDSSFRTDLLIAIVLGSVVVYNPLQTFLKDPDKVFLLVKENKMVTYFRYTLLYNYIVQLYIVIVALAVVTPLMSAAFPLMDGSHYVIVFFAVLMMKFLHLLIRWWMMNTRQSFQIIDLFLRFIVSAVFFYFLITEQWVFTFILLILLVVLFLNNFFLSRKNNFLNWERLIENDAFQQAKFYRIVSLFAEVPQMKTKIRKRKMLSGVINRFIPFHHDTTFDYLFRLTFVRHSDYLNLFIRLTILGSLLVIFVSNAWLSVLLVIVFIYLTAFQLLAQFNHHRTNIWLDLYPVQQVDKQSIFIKWMVQLTLVQTFIFAFVFLIWKDVGSFFLVISLGTLFNYVFHYSYVKKKISISTI